tara:strand:+ start:116 stop:463 length:348 start_codon:yes stop_codon:yes gene_type:complete
MKPNENYLSNEKNERLYDIAKVLRSKNAGPLFITLDIIFEDKNSYIRVKESGLINNSYISRQYNVEEKDVRIINFDAAFAIKVTIPRINCLSGSPGDTDVYGAQQHIPLTDLMIP